MPFRVRQLRRANSDVRSAYRWYEDNASAEAAETWYLRFKSAILQLGNSPRSFPLAVEAELSGVEIRELVFGKRRGKYRVLFVIVDDEVRLLRVRHSAQDSLTEEDIEFE